MFASSLRRTDVRARRLESGQSAVELAIGIRAERQPLEHVARPISAVD